MMAVSVGSSGASSARRSSFSNRRRPRARRQLLNQRRTISVPWAELAREIISAVLLKHTAGRTRERSGGGKLGFALFLIAFPFGHVALVLQADRFALAVEHIHERVIRAALGNIANG